MVSRKLWNKQKWVCNNYWDSGSHCTMSKISIFSTFIYYYMTLKGFIRSSMYSWQSCMILKDIAMILMGLSRQKIATIFLKMFLINIKIHIKAQPNNDNIVAQYLQAPGKWSQHFNATYHNIVGHNMLRMFGHPVVTCWELHWKSN